MIRYFEVDMIAQWLRAREVNIPSSSLVTKKVQTQKFTPSTILNTSSVV